MKVSRGAITLSSEMTIDANLDMNSYVITEVGGVTLVKNAGIQILTALVADKDFCGDTVLATAGEDIDQFEVVYLKSDGKVWKAKGDSSATMPIKGIATANVLADAAGVFLIKGFIRKDAWNWAIGDILYASDVTGGAITATIPDTSGDQIQAVGIAVTADIAWFRPDLILAEVT